MEAVGAIGAVSSILGVVSSSTALIRAVKSGSEAVHRMQPSFRRLFALLVTVGSRGQQYVSGAHQDLSFTGPAKLGFISGEINGKHLEAFVDTGTSLNIVSFDTVQSLGLMAKPELEKHVTLASGRKAALDGTVELTWKFDDEPASRSITCGVLRECSHPLILGASFLRLTETLTTFKHRIKSTLSGRFQSRRLAVNFFGPEDIESYSLHGYLDGIAVTAIPDSGSECCLMSAAYARKRKISVNSSPGSRYELEFLDGSVATTLGIARATWEFAADGTSALCDFLVLEGLPVDILFGNDFVERFNVFQAHQENVAVDFDLVRSLLSAFGVAMLRKLDVPLSNLVEESLRDRKRNMHFLQLKEIVFRTWDIELTLLLVVESTNPFSDEMIVKESARQNMIQQRIALLAESQREMAENLERERQLEWRRRKLAHEANQGRPPLAQVPGENRKVATRRHWFLFGRRPV